MVQTMQELFPEGFSDLSGMDPSMLSGLFSTAKAVFPIKNTAAKHKANPFIQIPLFRFYYIMSLFLC